MFEPYCESELQSVLNETRYLLQRWRFAASAAGFLWIQPVGPRMSPEELAGFIALLQRACRDAFPQAILFDFNDVEVVGAQWTMVESLLIDFAKGIGAKCRLTSSHKHPASAVLLYRGSADSLPVPPRPKMEDSVEAA